MLFGSYLFKFFQMKNEIQIEAHCNTATVAL